MLSNKYYDYHKDNRVALINNSVRIKLSYIIGELKDKNNVVIKLNWASYLPMTDVKDIMIF